MIQMSRCGGIGRHDRLKIYCPKGREGSIPSVGITVNNNLYN